MVKCSFCGHNMEKGTGKMYVRNDSNIFFYCSNKCEKNHLKLGRNPRKVKWTEDSRKSRNKSIV